MTADLIVVKCGGAIDEAAVCADIARRGGQVVVVHGGAAEIARLAGELGVPQRTLVSPRGESSRYTDHAMLDVLTLAMTGRVKPRLLYGLNRAGVRAVGLTGLDACLLRARRNSAQRAVIDERTVIVRDDHSGRIVEVATDLLGSLLQSGYTPVVSPPATGEDGGPLNVDADRVAAAVAGALRADRLVFLTGAAGVLREAADESTVLSQLTLPVKGPVPYATTGGMRRKLIAARAALLNGVTEVIIADGRAAHPVTETTGTVVEVHTGPEVDTPAGGTQ
jgi:acetylglutamate/LysW-gamma-L-alpha-aminoadipate kinase